MISLIRSIITNTLIALYQPFLFALLFSGCIMFIWKSYSSVMEAIKIWFHWFMTSTEFKKMFFFVFYTVMILMRTLLNRNMWENPVSDVIGNWWIWKIDGNTGKRILTTECFENLCLFIPFMILLLWNYRERIVGERVSIAKTIWRSTAIAFVFSFVIEMLQLFLRLGTWQLSDLFYNTLGGCIGSCIYWIGYKVKKRMKLS